MLLWAVWSRASFTPPVLWLVAVAVGMLTAWRAMLHGVGRQDWLSGGLFMFHVLSFLVLLMNVWSIGGRQ